MKASIFDVSGSTAEDDSLLERSRFGSIINRHIHSRGVERTRLRMVLLRYLQHSPTSDQLICDLISKCVDLRTDGRLDAAIDILSQLGGKILRYAREYLINDLNHWSHLYPDRAYAPNDDYWYILLRAVGQSTAEASDRVRFIVMCKNAASRQILEAVLESLGDVATDDAFRAIASFTSNPDPFIAKLATELLANR